MKLAKIIVAALLVVCVLIWMIKPFSNELNSFFWDKGFFFIMSIACILDAFTEDNKIFSYWLMISGLFMLCGALMPINSTIYHLTTIGLVMKVGVSLFAVFFKPKNY